MNSLHLEAHNDDIALFAAYAALRHGGHIVTCLRSYRQESLPSPIGFAIREDESWRAAEVLGCTWKQWGIREDAPYALIQENVRVRLASLLSEYTWERVYAPLPLDGGHDHHNLVGDVASSLVPAERLTLYATYRRGEGRTRTPNEVVAEPGWPSVKYQAMACFASQINEPTCQPWFATEDCLREWVA